MSNLVRENIGSDRLLAVVEQATTPFQQVSVHNIYEYHSEHKHRNYISPTLVIIGKVVQLHREFAWTSNHQTGDCYFDTTRKPLESREKSLVTDMVSNSFLNRF